ncbi:MAG: STAS/SEC14 domain-containing protein [Gammaproteobacteria bacterium]
MPSCKLTASEQAETIGTHFVSADIKSFGYGDMDKARAWILGE